MPRLNSLLAQLFLTIDGQWWQLQIATTDRCTEPVGLSTDDVTSHHPTSQSRDSTGDQGCSSQWTGLYSCGRRYRVIYRSQFLAGSCKCSVIFQCIVECLFINQVSTYIVLFRIKMARVDRKVMSAKIFFNLLSTPLLRIQRYRQAFITVCKLLSL